MEKEPTYKDTPFFGYENALFVCNCESVDHQIVFQYEKGVYSRNKEVNELWISIHLSNYRNFWKRLVYGFRYIFFNTQSRFGAFDTIELRPQDHEKFREVADYLTALNVERERLIALYGKENETANQGDDSLS